MNKKNKVFSNFMWRFFERTGAQGVKLLVEIVLARLLLPEDYGLIALVTVFITILNTFATSGLGSALVQKKNADDVDFSTVFWFGIVLSLVLYTFLFFIAPVVAAYYEQPKIISVLRVLGLQLLITSFRKVQHSFVSRTMQFKRFFFATLGGTVGAALIGIWMAYRGYGIWALVAQHLFNLLMDSIILWFTVKWRPRLVFSFERLRALMSFGWKLMLSSLIDTVYNEIRQLIIGKKYTSADLAFYNRGKQFPNLFVQNVNSAIDSVLLPIMSKEQDDRQRVKEMTRRAIKTSTYLIAPLMIGLAFVGEPFVKLLLTEKWLPSVFFMRVFCVSYMFYPIHTANLNAIKAMGRSDLFLKLEITKKDIGIIAILISMNISVEAMAYSVLFTSISSQILNSLPNRKLLGYKYEDQLKDILPGISLAVGMGAIVCCVKFLNLSTWLTLLIQIPLGAAIYVAGSMLFRIDSFAYVLSILKQFLKKKKEVKPGT